MSTSLDFVELVLRHGHERQAHGQMAARERLLAALCCRSTDILPFCLPGFGLYRWADQSYSQVLPAVACHTDPIHEVCFGSSAIEGVVHEPMREERLPNGDLWRTLTTPLGELTEVSRPSGMEDGSTTQARVKSWVVDGEDVRRFLSLRWEPSRRDVSGFLADRERLGNCALSIVTVYEPLQAIEDLMGTEALCILSASEPKLLRSLIDAILERIMEELRWLLAHGAGPVFRIAGGELAIPPLMALRRFEQYAFPCEQRMAEVIHAAGQHVLIHCHGNTSRLMERFIAAGADGVDPCEPPPIGGTDLAEAKRRVGGRLSLWGNLEYDMLSEATEAEVRDLTKRMIESGAPGGGFVLLPSCRLYERPLPERTRRNLLAVMEVAHEYR